MARSRGGLRGLLLRCIQWSEWRQRGGGGGVDSIREMEDQSIGGERAIHAGQLDGT